MDRFSFYRNIDRYKTCHNDSLEHTGFKKAEVKPIEVKEIEVKPIEVKKIK